MNYFYSSFSVHSLLAWSGEETGWGVFPFFLEKRLDISGKETSVSVRVLGSLEAQAIVVRAYQSNTEQGMRALQQTD